MIKLIYYKNLISKNTVLKKIRFKGRVPWKIIEFNHLTYKYLKYINLLVQVILFLTYFKILADKPGDYICQ